ncbi:MULTISPECIES: hypothetical protein [Rufibacter]|uniref:Lipoprotein n=1 Tax=Rufibacter quisquiliarum TaxID=1549639 RepID=A0A839GQZ3_9BACT|nr:MULTISPECIES: hypothetical protein [Rufibacter]MBA9079259.1 hypothetical protein [Rufibacter quisquiliarum]
MPFIVAGALLVGASCNTYTASTDPDDKGTGYALTDDKAATGHTSSHEVAEANNNATLDHPETQSTKDSAAAPAAKDSAAAPATTAPAAGAH